MASYSRAINVHTAEPYKAPYIQIENHAHLNCVLNSMAAAKKPVIKPRNRVVIETFLDRYGEKIAFLYKTIATDFGPYGILDKSDYASFLDVILSCLYMKQSTSKQHVDDDEDVAFI